MSASDRAAIKQAIQDYSLSNPGEALGMKQLRNELVERGLVFSDSRWNEALKPLVRDVIVEIDEEENVSEVEIPTPKPEKKTKYETAAQKNLAVGPHYRVREWKTEFGLQIFMDGISGSSRMEPASDDDEGEEEEEEDNDEDEDEVEIVEAKPNKKVASKKPPAKATSNYKSAAKITTSDDESGAEERRDRASKKARVSLESGEDDESKKGKVKVEKKPKEKAEKKPEEKTKKKPRARAVKPGDAERGTAEEEEKIKQLKVRCGAVGNPRFFNGTTGAERTLTAVERISILDDILRGAGFNRSGGAMPSIQKCQEVGDRRALEKEMKDISGAPIFETLRTGKKRVHDSESEDEPAAARKNGPPKKFGAFLGDQSSDSD